MTYDALERSTYSSEPFDLYLFDDGNGTTYALTNRDAAIVWSGRTFVPATITRDEIELSQEQTSGQVKVKIPKSHPIAALFVPFLPPSPITVAIYTGHDGDADVVAIFSGRVASARFPDECELTAVSDRDDLKRRVPTLLYQPSCPRVFCEPGCGIDPATVTYTGTISSFDATGTVLNLTISPLPPHSLVGGFLQRGNDLRLVIAQSGTTVTVMNAFSGLAHGQAFSARAGCDKTYANCASYANVANFLGFDRIPSRNPFDGRLI